MKITITVVQDWNNTPTVPSMALTAELQRAGTERAFSMISRGYHEGELCTVFDNVEYTGWWTITVEEVE